MNKKPTLYEILGVAPTADAASISEACARKLAELEAPNPGLSSAEVASAKQMVKIATSTLTDASSRVAYDAQLGLSHRASTSSNDYGSYSPSFQSSRTEIPALAMVAAPSQRDPSNIRAEAFALRAEALSLRADAMLLQANLSPVTTSPDRGDKWLSLMTSGPIWRLMILFGVMAAIAFGISRCAMNLPMQNNAAQSAAAEKAALQEYFQTHGVRPANMAELELLEAERRRKENTMRNEAQNVDQKERQAKSFEEESRRRGEEVAARLRAEEERHRMNVQMEQREADRALNERKEMERIAEERRIRKEKEQWQEIIRR